MPVLKNARHEKMAQALSKGKTADEAYVAAGFKANRGNAARLNANESIRARVEELLTRVAEKAGWTAADRLASLKAIHDASLGDDRRTAISAISEANRMQGSYAPAKHQHGGTIKTQSVTVDAEKIRGMSEDELNALESAIGKLLGSADDGESGEAAEAGAS